jgi:4-aminobutyrate aminotransferase/(S)-3-amino-2-methylpropionate transaminase
MENKAPGSPDLAILSFKSGFHGRLFGSLSATRSKAIHKARAKSICLSVAIRSRLNLLRTLQIDIPAFDWPAAPFPNIKYPLDANEAHNKAEEKRCLMEYEAILVQS